MRFKKKWIIGLATAILLSVMVIVSCSPIQAKATGPTGTASTGASKGLKAITVTSPRIARNRVLAYLRNNYPTVPASDVSWSGENISSKDAVATNNFLYSFKNWTVSVVSPRVLPERKVFTVVVLNENTGFKWAGLIDAYGKILQMGRLQATWVLPTPTLLPTVTPVPSSTPIPIPPTATPTAEACNDASFVEDVTIPDGSVFTPGTGFLKVWRLRNVGTCTWNTNYDLIYVGGNRMSAQRAVSLAETVKPGETVNLGVRMVAPQAPGNYQGFWMLRNASGKRFGIGDDASDSFWVSITVVANVNSYKYDFALNYCSAIWRSATKRLRCDDATTPQDGSVQFLINPVLENRHENEPTLSVHPNETRNGWIEGSYPTITVQKGDIFKAWVGCLSGYDLCDITFYLSYVDASSHVYTLKRWREVYDGKVTQINMSLDSLAGQTVQFILGAQANTDNFSNEYGFWFVPHIER